MFQATQWIHVPLGASGSSAIRASDRAPGTVPVKERGGETSLPSQVYSEGMGAPWANTGLLSSIVVPPPAASARRAMSGASKGRMVQILHAATASRRHPGVQCRRRADSKTRVDRRLRPGDG